MRTVKRELFSDQLFVERSGVFTETIGIFKNEHVNFPHWDLEFIGVDPIHQGKGYGNQLLIMKLFEIDKQNLACYLNTENERNIKLYEHFGFEIIDHAYIPNSELRSWAMIRKKIKI